MRIGLGLKDFGAFQIWDLPDWKGTDWNSMPLFIRPVKQTNLLAAVLLSVIQFYCVSLHFSCYSHILEFLCFYHLS
jgi:hypothetical protein